jgi:hypothetical protein
MYKIIVAVGVLIISGCNPITDKQEGEFIDWCSNKGGRALIIRDTNNGISDMKCEDKLILREVK